MADNKKSSKENILYQCLECKRHRVIKNGIDGSRCNYCDGHLIPIGPTNLPSTREGKKTIHYGELTVGVDVSEAIKGLKAVQREAKKTTAALKELEEQQTRNQSLPNIKGYSPHTVVFDEMHHVCRRCGENKLKLQPLGEGIKGVKLVCEDCGARQ